MNCVRTLSAAIIAVSALAATSAQATNVYPSNLGTVTIGEAGDVQASFQTVGSYSIYDVAYGTLSGDSQIVFTYKNVPLSGYASATGTYNTGTGTQYTITSTNGTTTETGTTFGLTGPVTPVSTTPVLVTSDFNSNGTVTTTIRNLSSTAVLFSSAIISGTTGISASFNVSGVPLPPAILLFVTGLVALSGFAAYKKNRDQA